RSIKRLAGKLDNFFGGGKGHALVRPVHRCRFFKGVTGSCRALPVETHCVAATATRRWANHRWPPAEVAAKTKRKIDVPTIRLQALLQGATRIRRRLDGHRRLHVSSLEPKHLF